MDFFDRQAHAQKQTRRLVRAFCLAALAALAVNNLLLCPLVACFSSPASADGPAGPSANFIARFFYLLSQALAHPGHFVRLVFHWRPVLWVSLGTLASIAGGCGYKIRELSDGGCVVAEFLGGRHVGADTRDADERRLRNVVEEMALASGTPAPEVYVLDCERGINAFAAGHTRDDVAIGVTRGGLKLLTRDELQGVIAHEFSHILNGDTRLNMRLIGLAHGFFWPTLLGRILIYGQAEEPAADATLLVEQDKARSLPTAPLGWLFVALGCSSLPLVRLIKSAICRQREWLADAAAVQFTRSPQGIAGALKKIGGLGKHGRLDTPHAEVASHLYFANSGLDPWLALLATHPPLANRILAIDPAFDGGFSKVEMLAPNQAERDEAFARAICQSMACDARRGLALEAISAITSEEIRRASLARLGLPAEVADALRTPAAAARLLHALILSGDDSVRTRQMEILQGRLASGDFENFRLLLTQVQSLDDKYKMPLAEAALPALRMNDAAGHAAFVDIQRQLIECDGSIGLFEYTLMKMVNRQLRSQFGGPAGGARIGRVRDLLPECALLLSALAHVGNDDEAAAQQAFAAGADFLDAAGQPVQFLSRSQWDLAAVDAAMTNVASYHEPVRRNVILACGKTVAADGRVTEREAELLRAIADTLDCPMPPFVEALRREELDPRV